MKAKAYHLKGDYSQNWEKADAAIDHQSLKIFGHPVMEKWEMPYMKELAKVASTNGGRILEVGFGLGIASRYIQAEKIQEHVVIEANKDVFKNLLEFAQNTEKKVIPIYGKWETIVPLLNDAMFDGILYDTYPLSEDSLHNHQFDFIKQAHRLLKPDGVLTYCNLTSWGHLKQKYNNDELFEQTQLPKLKSCGFNLCQKYDFAVHPPGKCKYYQFDTIIVPIAKK